MLPIGTKIGDPEWPWMA